jgi:hypothetical protein
MSGSMRQLTLPLLFALLLAAVWADPLLTRRNFSGRDLAAYNLPMEKAIHDAYSRGRLPLWFPEISGGRPLLPNPNAGALYPVRWLLSAASFPLAARIFPIFHWGLAAVGLATLLAVLGVSRGGQWVGGVTYAFSGVAVSELFFPHVAPGLALLPWILWALDRVQRPGSRRTLVLALLLALDLLAGDVFTAGLALAGALLWIGLETEPAERRGRFTALAFALCLALLVAAPQILATALWIPETSRAVIGIDLKDALTFSLSPWRLLELLIPYPFGATWSLENARVWGRPVFHFRPVGLHATLYTGVLSLFALAEFRRERGRGARFAYAFLLFALALSVLPSFASETWAMHRSPIALRNPEKFAVGITLALALLAGLAVDRFRNTLLRSRIPLIVCMLLAAGALFTALAPETSARAAVRTVGANVRLASVAAAEMPGALTEAGLFCFATLAAARLLGRTGMIPRVVALALLTAVPIAATRRIGQTFREEETFAPTAFARRVMELDPHGAYRTLGEAALRGRSALELAVAESDPTYAAAPRRTWTDHTQAFWGRGTIFNLDFDQGDFARVERLRRVATIAARHPGADVFFGNLALRFGIRFRDQEPLPGYGRFGGDLLQSWDEHAAAFPDLRLLERWGEETTPLAALNRIPFQRPGEIVIESGRRGAGSARPGQIQILEKTPESMRLRLQSPDPAWLFVLRGHWPYREVLLDGRPVRCVPAQIAFSSVPIPIGVHEIAWREQLPGGRVSAWGPVLAALLALLLLFDGRRRGQRRTHP